MSTRLDVAPLVGYVSRRGGIGPATRHLDERRRDRYRRLYQRAVADGALTAAAADEFAIRALGYHPALVWGNAWWLDEQIISASAIWRPHDPYTRRAFGVGPVITLMAPGSEVKLSRCALVVCAQQ